MGIIVKKTSEQLAIDAPAVHAWFPMKEERTGNTTEKVIIDYLKGVELVGSKNHDVALVDALRIVGDETASSVYADVARIGTELMVAPDENIIAIATMINADSADSVLGYADMFFNDAIVLSNGGISEIKAGGTVIADSISLGGGTIAAVVGLDRSTDEAVFNYVNTGGLFGSERRVDAAVWSGVELDMSGHTGFNGVQFDNGASGLNPLGVYNLIVAKFKGDFPTVSEMEAEMVQWWTDSKVGVKNIPAFIRNLSV